MAKPNSSDEQEIVRAQNEAIARWPDDLNARNKQRADLRSEVALKNAKIAQAKKEAGADATEKRLIETYGYKPQTIKIIMQLYKLTAADRAATMRQLIKVSDDETWVYPDLFDHGAIGRDPESESAGALFDATSEGKRRGGATAQPRTVEEMAASNENAGTPGIPLAEAERLFEEFLAAHPPKRGKPPKAEAEEQARLLAQIEAAKADAALADLPEAKPGEITEALREGNAESEQHIREAVDGPVAPPPADKPKRGRKAAGAKAAPPPPAEDDDEDEPGEATTAANHRPDTLGTATTSFQIG